MQIQANSVVNIHYTLKNDAGDVLDSSNGQEPLMYMHGYQNIIPALEQALEGKSVGDKFDVSIEPEDAYGERHEEAIQQVPLTVLADIPDLQVGMTLQAGTDQGPIPVLVVEITDEFAIVDGNHPLAGIRLNFTGTIESVREATESELEHGHAHGGDGHQH